MVSMSDDSPYPRFHDSSSNPGSRRQSINGAGAGAAGGAGMAAGGAAGYAANPHLAAVQSPFVSHSNLSNVSYGHDDFDDEDLGGKGGSSDWLRGQQKKSMWARWAMIIGSIVIVLAIVGGVVGAQVVKNRNQKSSGDLSSSSNSTSDANSVSNNNGQISVKPDSRLKHSFYGFAYTPNNAQYPACGATQDDVTQDIALLSQLTSRIRLYGMDCNISSMVLEAINQLNVNMTTYLGVWVDGNSTTLQRQTNDLYSTLKQYGASHVDGVTVGNEVIFAQYATASDLGSYMNNIRTQLGTMNLGKTLPVGTADLASNWAGNSAIIQDGDYLMANDHPYFANVTVDIAANWTIQFLNDNVVNVAGNKPVIISEVGWPTANKDRVAPVPVASMQSFQQFLDTWVCAVNSLGVPYYFFEAFDEPWKAIQFNDLESHWGLFYSNRTLKEVTIPDCAI